MKRNVTSDLALIDTEPSMSRRPGDLDALVAQPGAAP